MLRNKISEEIKVIVKYLLRKNYSYSAIQQELAQMDLTVSKSTISRISNEVGKQRELGLLNDQKSKFPRRRHISVKKILQQFDQWLRDVILVLGL